MKLIEILVQELPKRGGWPDGYDEIATNGYGAVWAYKTKGCIVGSELHFHSTTEGHVTREQYEAALAASKEMLINKPQPDGWIAWGGGECPVDGDVVVDVRYRGGFSSCRLKSGLPASEYGWGKFDGPSCIIAYRLHKPEDDQPVWNGEGRPPVGVKCEHCPGGTTQHQWEVVTVVAVHENLVSGFTDYWLVREDGSSYLVGNPYRFRPIRTEAERKREDIIDELVSVFISHHGNPKGAEGYRSIATKLYDKVISKKLEAPDEH